MQKQAQMSGDHFVVKLSHELVNKVTLNVHERNLWTRVQNNPLFVRLHAELKMIILTNISQRTYLCVCEICESKV